jgi:hypothetical protein
MNNFSTACLYFRSDCVDLREGKEFETLSCDDIEVYRLYEGRRELFTMFVLILTQFETYFWPECNSDLAGGLLVCPISVVYFVINSSVI